MTPRYGIVIVLLAGIVAAGCTRDAGVQPFDPQVEPIGVVTDLPPDVDVTAELMTDDMTEDVSDDGPGIAITVLPPTATDIPLLNVTEAVDEDDAPTLAPADDEGDVMDDMDADDENEGDAQSVVPGGPQGPVPIVTSTRIPTVTPAPDLITPTSVAQPADDDDDEDGTTTVVSEDGCEYVVQTGDNAFRIAVNNNVTLAELQDANPDVLAPGSIIQPGDTVIIPGCGDGPLAAEAEPTEELLPTVPGGFVEYTVVSGDTLGGIAAQFDVTIAEIVEASDLENPDQLSIGQRLLIPTDGTAQ